MCTHSMASFNVLALFGFGFFISSHPTICFKSPVLSTIDLKKMETHKNDANHNSFMVEECKILVQLINALFFISNTHTLIIRLFFPVEWY